MKIVKNKKKKKFKIFHFLGLILIGYTTFTLVNQQIQITQKRKKLEELSEQVKIQQIKNNQLNEIANSDFEDQKEYIERIARSDLELAKKGERVFVNVPGN